MAITFGKPSNPGAGQSSPAKTFGGGTSANTSAGRPAAQQQAPRPIAAPAPAASPFARAGGLPPATVDPGEGGGGYAKRDDDYWQAHPLAVGDYTFVCHVKAVLWSSSNEVSVKFQATDWDRAANRPGDHHQRPVPDRYGWKQTARPGISEKGYANWRRDLVASYTAGGWPESSWQTTADGSPVPPWPHFFVHECADGSHVPIMLAVVCNVPPPRDGSGLFCNVKKVVPVQINGGFVQAPMPWEVHPDLAAFHKWRHGEAKSIAGRDGSTTQLVPLDRDQFALGHLGMLSYKDL